MSTQKEYRSLRKFSIGNPAIDIPKDATLLFDGYTLILEGRPPVPLPQLRGAITTGWLVEASTYHEGMQAPPPQSANISIRPADGGNPMEPKARIPVTSVQEEERVVGSYRGHAQAVQNRNNGVVIEQQDGVPVRHLGRPTQRGESTELTPSNVNRAIEASKARPVQPGQGRTREDMMAQMTPQERANYQAQLDARRAQHVDLDERVAVPPSIQYPVAGPDGQGHVVATVISKETRSTSREGIQTAMSVGGGIETVDLSGATGPIQTRVVEREGIRFTETNGPKKGAPPAPLMPPTAESPVASTMSETDSRRIIAKTICSDFPDIYDFDAAVRKKIARIQADFEGRPDIIRAIAAAETDSEMRTRLVEEFPSAFGRA